MSKEVSLVDKQNLDIWLYRLNKSIDNQDDLWVSENDCKGLKELLEELKKDWVAVK